jgi:CIC family chloride channel protein
MFPETQQRFQDALKDFLVWRNKHLKDKQFVYFLSLLIGLISGFVAVVIKNTVHLVELMLTTGISAADEYLLFLYPVLGVFITVLVVRFVLKAQVGHGIPNALYAISKGNANMDKKGMYSSIISAAITVGFGGSVGLEGPTVATTTAMGSNLGKTLQLNYKTKVLLIACASSAALAALFKAPVAAIVFALEVIMIDLSAVSLVPILLATISATLTSRLLFGDEILFHFDLTDSFNPGHTFFYVLLGITAGVVSVYFTRVYFFIASTMEKIKSIFLRALLGAGLLGALIYAFPPLYGEGYSIINALITGHEADALAKISWLPQSDNFFIVVAALAALILLKTVATVLTLKSGGVGGIFAPSLFLGTLTGYAFARLVKGLGLADLSTSNFTLVAMGGLMAGVLHAPLTGIFLIAEITGGYDLFLPLMITSSIAFITVKYATPHSVYTRQLAQRGELITHHKDRAVLTLMNLKSEIETNFSPIEPYRSLGDLVQIVAKSQRNLFPVVDEKNRFLGVVALNDIREVMFLPEKYEELKVHEVMTSAPEFIYESDNMEVVMQKFDSSGAWNLPVLNEDGIYKGFVSKSKLFSAYRTRLKDFYDDVD